MFSSTPTNTPVKKLKLFNLGLPKKNSISENSKRIFYILINNFFEEGSNDFFPFSFLEKFLVLEEIGKVCNDIVFKFKNISRESKPTSSRFNTNSISHFLVQRYIKLKKKKPKSE